MFNMFPFQQQNFGLNALQMPMFVNASRTGFASSPTIESCEKQKSIEAEEFNGILEAIKSRKLQGDLELRDRGINKYHLKKLVSVLLLDTQITGINLSKNDIDDSAIHSLIELIKINTKIKMINLAGNSLSRSAITLIELALKNNFTVTAMDVGVDCPAIENILVRNQQIKCETLRLDSYIETAKAIDSVKLPKVLSNIILSYYSGATLAPAQERVQEYVIEKALNFVYNPPKETVHKVPRTVIIDTNKQEDCTKSLCALFFNRKRRPS